MATEKQIDWAVKLARWNKQDISRADVEALSAEQLDELFANLKKVTVSKKPAVEESVVIKQPDFNGARFGLACKIVLSNANLNFVFNNKEIYIKRIMQYYNIMTEAEKAQHELVLVGDPDADQLRDAMIDNELVAKGLM